MKSEQKLTSLSFDPFPSFSILFCVKGEKGGKRKQKENALFLMHMTTMMDSDAFDDLGLGLGL